MKKALMICSVMTALASSLVLAAPDKAPGFALTGLDGKQFKLEENMGKGYIVLNFWARWCTSCEEEVPELAALKKSPGADHVLFIGVNVGDAEAKAAKFVKKFKYPYDVVMDKDKETAKKYGVLGLPATLIISKDGKIVFRGSRPPKTFDFTK